MVDQEQSQRVPGLSPDYGGIAIVKTFFITILVLQTVSDGSWRSQHGAGHLVGSHSIAKCWRGLFVFSQCFKEVAGW